VSDVPAVVLRFVDAHDRRDADGAFATFMPDALVSRDGRTDRGRVDLWDWQSRASVEFTSGGLLSELDMAP
jgi:hypothetical protein